MSQQPLNSAEDFVLRVCQRSCLSLWCFNNPEGKDGDELCDIHVVCDPHVLIISVKAVTLKDSGNRAVDLRRWERRAIDRRSGRSSARRSGLHHLTPLTVWDNLKNLNMPDAPAADRAAIGALAYCDTGGVPFSVLEFSALVLIPRSYQLPFAGSGNSKATTELSGGYSTMHRNTSNLSGSHPTSEQ
jgi:hypothetical protein